MRSIVFKFGCLLIQQSNRSPYLFDCAFFKYWRKCANFRVFQRLALSFWRLITFFVIFLLLSVHSNSLSAPEDELRAAVVFGVLRFVKFPDDNARDSMRTICLIGKPRSQTGIASALKQSLLKDRKYNVTFKRKLSQTNTCDVVIVGKQSDLKRYYKKSAVSSFIICDSCLKGTRYSAVSIYQEGKRIRFSVNLDVARKVGITFDSNILEHAAEVIGGDNV